MNTKQFIERIAEDLDIKIEESSEPIPFASSYWIDDNGSVSLKLYGPPLHCVEKFTPISERLIKLDIYDSTEEETKNLKSIESFTQLEELELFTELLSLQGLEKLSDLKKLDISYLMNDAIKEIEQLKLLQDLSLSFEFPPIVRGLENLSYLENLKISGVEAIDAICGIKTLKKLVLKSNAIANITGLDRFPDLEHLNLDCTQIAEITGLEHLKNLRLLSLGSTYVTEIKGLESLIALEYLDLNHTSIPNIKGLETLVNLKTLSIDNYLGESETPIKEINGLEHLSKLETLVLTGHRITELKKLPANSLKLLDVAWNKIEFIDYDWLNTIEHPCTINLTGNPIEINLEEVPKNITIITNESTTCCNK